MPCHVSPLRAPVRPLVSVRGVTSAIALDLLATELLQAVRGRIVAVTGGSGAGKSLAIAHLAALAGPDADRFTFLDNATYSDAVYSARKRPVCYAGIAPSGEAPNVVTVRLLPWGDDQLIEYVLARHRGRCGSVMNRVRGWSDRGRLAGIPELWAAVLDALAADDGAADWRAVLTGLIRRDITRERQRAKVARWCLAALTDPASSGCGWFLSSPRRAHRWVRHPPVQLMLSCDLLGGQLEAGRGAFPKGMLPIAVVKELGRRVARSDMARSTLEALLRRATRSADAWAASTLHAADPAWRPRHGSKLSLIGARLDGARWPGIDLVIQSAARASLCGADLSGATLRDSDLSGADAAGATLSHAGAQKLGGRETNFAGADLSFADAAFADLDRAILDRANLEGARMSGASLGEASLRGTRLVRADLSAANMVGVDAEDAGFSAARLDQSVWMGTDLRTARFTGARLSGVRMRSCDLSGTDLTAVDMASAVLMSVDLTGSCLRNACLAGATLQNCGLADVDWEGVDLRGADLRTCTFHMGSSRSGLVFSPIASEGTRTGFYTDEFDERGYKSPEEIRKANLCGADLRGAKILGVDFYLVDVRNARVDDEQLTWLRRCGAILRSPD